MESQDIVHLLHRYKSGICTEREKALLESWYLNSDPETIRELSSAEFSMDLLMIGKKLPLISAKPPVRSLWPRIVWAAAAVILIAFGLYFFAGFPLHPDSRELSSGITDVAPGKQGATLTLANGKKIRLGEVANGEVVKEAGVNITKTADGQLIYEQGKVSQSSTYNTLSTAKGETYQIKLPDGSLVYLNAASSLTYTAALLEQGIRKVKLEGEAYFQVAKDQKHLFVVETKGQEVQVLGTHFNINGYADEGRVKTTLLEGSVRLTGLKEQKILKPGQQAILSKDSFQVSAADIEESLAWKNGLFMFNDKRLEDIMKMVSRWYDVEVDYHGDEIRNERFSGTVSRFNNVSELLKVLESSGLVHFKIEGRKILINP